MPYEQTCDLSHTALCSLLCHRQEAQCSLLFDAQKAAAEQALNLRA